MLLGDLYIVIGLHIVFMKIKIKRNVFCTVSFLVLKGDTFFVCWVTLIADLKKLRFEKKKVWRQIG